MSTGGCPSKHGIEPRRHGLGGQQNKRRTLKAGRLCRSPIGGCNDRITTVRQRNPDRRVCCAVRHLERVRAQATLKPSNMNGFAGRDRMEVLAYKIEIGDAVDLLIIRNAERAVAEAHLRPDIDLGPLAALPAGAAEGQARRPSIAPEWPRDL